jgi:hypothetical protein
MIENKYKALLNKIQLRKGINPFGLRSRGTK